jgi:hypothetical protein
VQSLSPHVRLFAFALLATACDETIAPTPSPATTTDGGAPNGPDGGTLCTGTPNDNMASVIDSCGIFVSPNGNDGAPGTKAAPVASLTKAVELAHPAFKNVYVCGGTDVTYSEPATVTLASSDTGRGIFGGLSCDAWSFDDTRRPTVVVPGAGQPIFRVDGAKDARIENLHIISSDAVDPGTSSIAIFVASGAHLRVRHINIDVGRGADGAPGVDAPAQVAAATDGVDATGLTGGAGSACSCPDGTVSGGAGGAGGNGGADAGAGESGAPILADSGTGGRVGSACDAGGAGGGGRDGDDGDAGAHSFRYGELAATAWNPRLGLPGAVGKAAQGGGGGAGALAGGGGGGGCGGCGGAPGQAAQTGGGSIAIAVFQADLDVIESLIFLKRGGDGGKGGAGQPGQPGGTGGAPAVGGGCGGGSGGSGGAGGGGGGGSGGHSVAVLYKGPIPTLDGPSSAAARLGVPGKGGLRGGATVDTDRAPPGVAAALWISD